MAKKSKKSKFQTLTHNGYKFPTYYEAQGLTLNEVRLSPLAEEMLNACSKDLETDYYKSEIYHKNFWSCLKPELSGGLENLNWPTDFEPLMKSMKAKSDLEKEEAKALKNATSKEDKLKEKEENDKIKEYYGMVSLNGKKQPCDYQIEPPGIMKARGKSPLLGLWKYRTEPEDVIVNWCPCDEDEWEKLTPALKNYYYGFDEDEEKPDTILSDMDKEFIKLRPDILVAPKAPEGHNWKEVTSARNAFLIGKYKVNYGGVVQWWKKMMFGASSSVKVSADQKKFEKALKLIKDWDKMEAHISKGLKSKDKEIMEAALISYLIKSTSIRVGNEKDEIVDNETVGASTLLVKNIRLEKIESDD